MDATDKKLNMELNCVGTKHQLIYFLRSVIEQIERDSVNKQLPWYCKSSSSCGFMGNFEIKNQHDCN